MGGTELLYPEHVLKHDCIDFGVTKRQMTRDIYKYLISVYLYYK